MPQQTVADLKRVARGEIDTDEARRNIQRGVAPDEIEPELYRVLNLLPPSKLDWLKQQRLRVAESLRLARPAKIGPQCRL